MTVKVKRERADQRRHHRVTASLFVDVGDYRIRAADWSLGGLRIEEYPDAVPVPGDQLSLHLTLPFQGFDVSFDVKSEVVRCDPAVGMFAVRFTEVGERERELMSHFIEELVRGSMVGVEDTIQRIDVPVTPASLKPDTPALRHLPVRRWPIRTVAMTAFYGVVGTLVFAYAAVLAYTNLAKLEVQTAVITAPVEMIAAQADGVLKLAPVKAGDAVRAGEVLVEVIDNQIQRDLELAEIAVGEQKGKLAYLRRRQLEEMERVKSFATVELKNVQQSKLEAEAIAAQLHAAELQQRRFAKLHDKGFTTDAKLEEAEKLVTTLKKQLEAKQVEIRSRLELADQNLGRRHYTGENIVGELGSIEAQVKLAEHEIELARQRKDALLHHQSRLAVKSPFDGTVLSLTRADSAQVRRGDVVAVVEQRRDRTITAFLNQDEVNRIGLGDVVVVFVPALGETLKAHVASIDRTSGFVREQEQRQTPGYGWRGPSDRSARVELTFDDPSQVADHERYRSGLPVIAIFPQRSTSALMNAVLRKLALAS